jgi:hypothetical protein
VIKRNGKALLKHDAMTTTPKGCLREGDGFLNYKMQKGRLFRELIFIQPHELCVGSISLSGFHIAPAALYNIPGPVDLGKRVNCGGKIGPGSFSGYISIPETRVLQGVMPCNVNSLITVIFEAVAHEIQESIVSAIHRKGSDGPFPVSHCIDQDILPDFLFGFLTSDEDENKKYRK